MAKISKTVSDVTGVEGLEDNALELVVRDHPAISEPKKLDYFDGELDALKSAGEIVVLEIGSNGDKRQLIVTLTDFRKLVKDEVVKKARGTRGRTPGYSPKNGN